MLRTCCVRATYVLRRSGAKVVKCIALCKSTAYTLRVHYNDSCDNDDDRCHDKYDDEHCLQEEEEETRHH